MRRVRGLYQSTTGQGWHHLLWIQSRKVTALSVYNNKLKVECIYCRLTDIFFCICRVFIKIKPRGNVHVLYWEMYYICVFFIALHFKRRNVFHPKATANGKILSSEDISLDSLDTTIKRVSFCYMQLYNIVLLVQ